MCLHVRAQLLTLTSKSRIHLDASPSGVSRLPCGQTLPRFSQHKGANVDYLLLSAIEKDTCTQGYIQLGQHSQSADCGFKTSCDKLHWCQPYVQYLGFIISQGSKRLSPTEQQDVIGVVLHLYLATNVKFLGTINYWHQWILD